MPLVQLTPGMLFARDFRVEALLSAGGMGAVYRATQESTGRTRALKIMLPELLADPKARERFAQEARVGGRIESANVVEVIAAGVDEATVTPWLAMEHLDGQDLAQLLMSQGRLGPAIAFEVLLQVCDALGAAHRVGVVHCDLKPENVFLSKPRTRGSNVLVKVLDFGIARLVQENRSSVQVTTAMGSPLFMAPEQGKRGQSVKPATDVWALGLLSFHALTGRHYWRSANVAADDFDLMQQIVEVATGELTPPSVRLRELGVADVLLPAGFDAWFAGCVVRDVSRRFPTAVEAGDALERVFAAAPSASPVASSPPQVSTQIALPSMPLPGGAPVAPVAVPQPSRPSPPSADPQPPAGYQIASQVAVPSMTFDPARAPDAPPASPPVRSRAPLVGGAAAVATAVVGVAVWLSSQSGHSPAAADAGAAATSAAIVDAASPPPPPPPPPPPTTCPSDMVLIPSGEFLMGSPDGTGDADEHPQHRVRFAQAFCMDRTETSVSAYRACVTSGACTAPDAFSRARGNAYAFCNWDRPEGEDHPVNCVDWTQAKAFCEWTGHADGARRLPRESEWEYAARGSANRVYPWGDAAPDGTRTNLCGDECVRYGRAHGFSEWSSIASWHDDFGATAPVTSFPTGATPEGLLNMGGNVWEWVADAYAADAYAHHDAEGFYAREASDASQVTESRVRRGGGWGINVASGVRAANRSGNEPADRNSGLGFRCARGVR